MLWVLNRTVSLNRLNETVLLSTQDTRLNWWVRKYLQSKITCKVSLSWPMEIYMSVIVKSHKLSKYMVYYYAGVRTTFCLLFDTILCKEKVFEAHNYSCCVSSWRGGGWLCRSHAFLQPHPSLHSSPWKCIWSFIIKAYAIVIVFPYTCPFPSLFKNIFASSYQQQ